MQAEVARESHGKLGIVACLPAFNEEKSIAKTILKTSKYVDEVIVVDDGSTDYTSQIASQLGAKVIRHERNLGKGAALKSAFDFAFAMHPNVVVTIDADDQHDPDEIPRLVEPILTGKADVVNGSRVLGGQGIPRYRRLGNRALNTMTNLASKLQVTDSQSGYRAYSGEALQSLEITEFGFGVDSQLLIEASSHGMRVVEVPVGVKYDENSSTDNPVKHGLGVMVAVVRTVAEKSPLLYLGVPATAFGIVGLGLMFYVLQLYNTTRYFSLPFALISVASLLLGILLAVAAMVLYAISDLVGRLRA